METQTQTNPVVARLVLPLPSAGPERSERPAAVAKRRQRAKRAQEQKEYNEYKFLFATRQVDLANMMRLIRSLAVNLQTVQGRPFERGELTSGDVIDTFLNVAAEVAKRDVLLAQRKGAR